MYFLHTNSICSNRVAQVNNAVSQAQGPIQSLNGLATDVPKNGFSYWTDDNNYSSGPWLLDGPFIGGTTMGNFVSSTTFSNGCRPGFAICRFYNESYNTFSYYTCVGFWTVHTDGSGIQRPSNFEPKYYYAGGSFMRIEYLAGKPMRIINGVMFDTKVSFDIPVTGFEYNVNTPETGSGVLVHFFPMENGLWGCNFEVTSSMDYFKNMGTVGVTRVVPLYLTDITDLIIDESALITSDQQQVTVMNNLGDFSSI